MKQKDERRELEQLLETSKDSLSSNVISTDEAPELNNEPIFDDNFDDIQNECNKQAKKIIYSLSGFMLTDDIIRNNKYLYDKMKVDIISMSGLLYQLKTNELMQKTLMEQVRSGGVHPRNFEVFGQLSKIIGELNKQIIQTNEVLKNTYRDLNQDVKEKQQEMQALTEGNNSSNGILRNSNGIVSLGTKELIKSVKMLKQQQYLESKNANIEEVKPLE